MGDSVPIASDPEIERELARRMATSLPGTDQCARWWEGSLKRETPHTVSGGGASARLAAERGYFLAASIASFSRYFFAISSCSCFGTTAYRANSIVNVPFPWVAERRSVE
jgi:hypothetical protein